MQNIDAVIITLDPTNKDRYLRAKEVILGLGFRTVKPLKAVDGRKLPDEALRNIMSLRAYNEMKYGRLVHEAISAPGAIGCALSHIKAWEIAQNSDRPLAVFEDDFDTGLSRDKCQEVIQGALEDAQKHDFDILRLGHSVNDECRLNIPDREVTSRIKIIPRLQGGIAYIITPRGASRLLSRALPIEMHVDYYMSFMNTAGLVREFASENVFRDPNSTSVISHIPLRKSPECQSANKMAMIMGFVLVSLVTSIVWFSQRRRRL